jgi:uncharacterized protein (DUF488 family)
MMTLFTIGHSTHAEEEFLALLLRHQLKHLVDVRRFPGSRKHPHFNQEHFATALRGAGVEYHWLEALGGRRHSKAGASSANGGLRNESFRSYADYMQTAPFRAGIAQLLKIAESGPTAYMCSEGLFWRCHRRLISDYLLAQQIEVRHVMPNGDLQPHALTTGAEIHDGTVTYPAAKEETTRTLFDK